MAISHQGNQSSSETNYTECKLGYLCIVEKKFTLYVLLQAGIHRGSFDYHMETISHCNFVGRTTCKGDLESAATQKS